VNWQTSKGKMRLTKKVREKLIMTPLTAPYFHNVVSTFSNKAVWRGVSIDSSGYLEGDDSTDGNWNVGREVGSTEMTDGEMSQEKCCTGSN
jgi:hypothetical protein